MIPYDRLYRQWLLPFFDRTIKGRKTVEYWRAAEESQWWQTSQLLEKQVRDLRHILEYAFKHCDYYCERWGRLGLKPNQLRSLQDFHRWPVLEREDVRIHRMAMRSKDGRKILTKSTGGSTGEPVVFDIDTESNERRTAMTYRGYDWASGGPGARRLLIWGASLNPTSWLRKSKIALHHWFDNERMINCFDMSRETMPRHFDAIQSFRPKVIIAYTNPLFEFARFLKETSRKPTGVASLIVGAEKIYPFQRELIEEVFDAPVFETYGSREFMLIGAECEQHSGLHLSMENLLVEILDENGVPTPEGMEGDVVITDLFNRGMPMIRYRNGDRAIAGFTNCECGRGLPKLRSVVGRQLDVIQTPSGKVIPGEFFPHFFKDFPEVRRFQIEQSTREAIDVRIVFSSESNPSQRDMVIRQCKLMLPEICVNATCVKSIPLTRSGKLQVVVNRLR